VLHVQTRFRDKGLLHCSVPGAFGSLLLAAWIIFGFLIILLAITFWLGNDTLVGKRNTRRFWLCHILFFGAYGGNVIEESSRELNCPWKD